MKYVEDDIFELSFSKPCSVCNKMLKAASRKGCNIKIKWSLGDINQLATPYININELCNSTPSLGTRMRYRTKIIYKKD